jgi:hypothetical protein
MNNIAIELLGESVAEMVAEMSPTGSREICNPPPTETDQDYIVLVKEDFFGDFICELGSVDWETEGSEIFDEYDPARGPEWKSMRHGEVNIIATPDAQFYRRFVAATEFAKKLNLLEKADRITLFQAVLYGNPPAQVAA